MSEMNTYQTGDGKPVTIGQSVVFLSHRSADKPVVRALSRLVSALGIHFWLDEADSDLQRAAQLGMTGDAALVLAIERGVRHSTHLIGLLSPRTMGSWWVPYEIGFARAQSKVAVFVALELDEDLASVPEFARVAPIFTSVDEIARWLCSLTGADLHSDTVGISGPVTRELASYLPAVPRTPTAEDLSRSALEAIELLARTEVQAELSLRSRSFAWMPATSPAIRGIAYALLAPLAAYKLNLPSTNEELEILKGAASALTSHYALAAEEPSLQYSPEVGGWKQCRYDTPATTWMQGLRTDQLDERLERFLCTRTHANTLRLATRSEFLAEFDRVVARGDESAKRALGVLVNPLFGFVPSLRPVYWRVLAAQSALYARLLAIAPPDVFDQSTRTVGERFARNTLSY
jgi:hypothetical protein